MVALTPVPQAPAWLAGVINLRGHVIPVMDLRARLNLSRQSPGLNTRIIVVALGDRMIGLLADEVVEVLTRPEESIEPPDTLTRTADVVSAILRAEARLITVLDLERVIDVTESLVQAEP